MTEFALILFGACLVNNLVLDHLLGVCPGVALSRRIDVAVDFSAAAIAILGAASFLSYPIHRYLLEPLKLHHLELIAFVFVILAVIQLGGTALERFRPRLHGRIAVFVPLLMVNCSVVGVALLNVRETHGFAGSLAFGLGSGAGFGLVLLMLAAMQDRIDGADVPAAFRGIPVLLLTLGFLSMAFTGFTGLAGP